MADICYLCSDEGSVEYPLVQCEEVGCDRWCCRLHNAPFNGGSYCLHHQGQHLLTALTDSLDIVQAKIDTPPELTSFDDVEAELADMWELLKVLADGLVDFNDNVARGIRDGRLYA